MKHNPEFLKMVDDARSRIRECSVNDLKARLDAGESLRLVDVREDHEWVAGGWEPEKK